MSGNQSKRSKKIGKNKDKNKINEVVQVKSVKLKSPTKSIILKKEDRYYKKSARSEGYLLGEGEVEEAQRHCEEYNWNEESTGDVIDYDTRIADKIRELSLKNKNGKQKIAPSTSGMNFRSTLENPGEIAAMSTEQNDFFPLPCPNIDMNDQSSLIDEFEEPNYAYRQSSYNKNNNSIKFSNHVSVLYFNGDNDLGKFEEPLKKELDQQMRNREMRRAHIIKGPKIDNVYLY